MPELPEVEITARRLDRAVAESEIASALAPGMNTMKTFDPPLDSLEGRKISGVRRIGKMPVIEIGDHALLIHLMSAGRLQPEDPASSPSEPARQREAMRRCMGVTSGPA